MPASFETKLQALVRQRSGIVLEGAKLTEAAVLVKQRLRASPDDALFSLEMKKELPEWLISTLTINETFFFRHPNQFEEVRRWIAARASVPSSLDCVCLGCSTGEESYSLAMLLAEDPRVSSFTVTGVDIDPVAIETARSAHYPTLSLARTPSTHRRMLEKYSEVTRVPGGQRLALNRGLTKNVRFRVGNCLTEDVGAVDLVFARNVLIYFAPADRERTIRRLRKSLNPDGLLLIGAGELFPNDLKEHGGPAWRLGAQDPRATEKASRS